jgi:hypothetical protein
MARALLRKDFPCPADEGAEGRLDVLRTLIIV